MNENQKFCQNCGAKVVDISSKFCTYCGSELASNSLKSNVQSNQRLEFKAAVGTKLDRYKRRC